MSARLLAEEEIRRKVGNEIFQRGRDYQRQGAVSALAQRGESIQAEVEGSDIEPYHVTVTFDAKGETEAVCDCPYEYGGWCKHIVAVLLAYLDAPEAVEERPPLAALLANLERDTLQALVQKLAEHHPNLQDEIEAQIEILKSLSVVSSPTSPKVELPPLDVQAIRRQARSLTRSAERGRYSGYYDNYGVDTDSLDPLLQEAQERIEAGDGLNAMLVLEAITDEMKDAIEYEEEGEVAGLFSGTLAPMWAEAILTADLSPGERKLWEKKLQGWDKEIREYTDGGFASAIEAARQGWDNPQLLRVLRGEVVERSEEADDEDEDWEEEEEENENAESWYADELTTARLNILERRGRFQEALNLAKAAGQDDRYTILLVKLGRIAEAVAHALQTFTLPQQSFRLAQALVEKQAMEEALRVGQAGLQLKVTLQTPFYVDRGGRPLQGAKAELARWLRDLALAHSRLDIAIYAGQVAAQDAPNLPDYELLQQISGERWPTLRTELLAQYRRVTSYTPVGIVDIFLYEGLHEEALRAVADHYDYDLIGRVVDAALASHPERVLPICRKHAETIMDGGKSERYHYAAQWLARAKQAYLNMGRKAEWQEYLDTLLAKHQRKYKLVPLLKNL